MLQKVILIFLLCVLQFQFYHSRYVLIDVYDQDDGPRAPGCGDWCFANCTGDPRCPHCVFLRCRPYNFIDQLRNDTGLKDIEEVRKAMNDRDAWKTYQT